MFGKRKHYFEFNDLEKLPLFLREGILETLAIAMEDHCYHEPLLEVLNELRPQFGNNVIDQCSGSGGPILSMLKKCPEDLGMNFFLSDLNPQIENFASIKESFPGFVDFLQDPVDATNFDSIKAEWHQRFKDNAIPKIRTINNGFHHFSPELAKKVLQDAAAHKQALVIMECLSRESFDLLLNLRVFGLRIFKMPFAAKKRNTLKFLFTYLLPVLPLIGGFDMFVSCLRIHEESDLSSYLNEIGGTPDYQFEFRTGRTQTGAYYSFILGKPTTA